MKLGEFVEKFVDGFENHIQDLANGNGSKLLNLRDEYEQKAVSYYDEITDDGGSVTKKDLIELIELEKEKMSN